MTKESTSPSKPTSSSTVQNEAFKRVRHLDALRGLAILFMIFGHLYLVGGGLPTTIIPGQGTASDNPIRTTLAPLATGLILFFFVSGYAISIATNRRMNISKQSLPQVERHVIARYGTYVVLSVIIELFYMIAISTLRNTPYNVLDLTVGLLGGFPTSWSQPILGLGLSVIIAAPLIAKMDWKKILIISLILGVVEGIIVYTLPVYPSNPIVQLLFADRFALAKGVPMVLFGGGVGKWLQAGHRLGKYSTLAAFIGFASYVAVPIALGLGMNHFNVLSWAYPHAMLWMIFASVLATSMFQFLESRRLSLVPLMVVGRSAFFVFNFQFLIMVGLNIMIYVYQIVLPQPIIVALMIGITVFVWFVAYAYGRWRWGPPSKW